MTTPEGDGEDQDDATEFAPLWETVDRIAGQLPDENALLWLRRVLERDEDNLAACDVGILTVWSSKDGRSAVFRVGWRVPMFGLLDYARRVIDREIEEEPPAEQ